MAVSQVNTNKMLNFHCGSTQPIDESKFDGVVIGYHHQLFSNDGEQNPLDFPGKIIRSHFLYGHQHKKPHPLSECETIEQWVKRRVNRFPNVNEWLLVNEFTDDVGVPYEHYKIDDLKRYYSAAYEINPNAKLIIGDFKPYHLKKWRAIANITNELKEIGIPIEVGIQNHLKFVATNVFRWNAPVVLSLLNNVIDMFDCPVHFIECSLWYKHPFDKVACKGYWNELLAIAKNNNIASFCQWWLTEADAEVGGKMPTFKDLKVYIPES